MKSKTIYPRKLLIALTDAQYHKLCAIANARHHGQLGATVRALIDRRKAPVIQEEILGAIAADIDVDAFLQDIREPKFTETWCSNCGRKFGPGDHGYSHCDQHGEKRLDQTKYGVRVQCSVCGHTKQPMGRSAPPEAHFCNSDCRGYDVPPYVGSLWPDESEAEFGYKVGELGVRFITPIEEAE